MPQKTTITKDTLVLTGISMALQGLSLILNMLITKKLGTAALGVTSLIFSFYTFAIVFSNGNIFTSTSRFVSEEIGKGNGNVPKIVSYALTFSITLSVIVGGVVFYFAPKIGLDILKSQSAVFGVRLMAISLPLATIGSCLKGYFHAVRHVKKPCIADVIEFLTKFAVIMSLITFLVPKRMELFTAIAISLVFGELSSCLYLSFSYFRQKTDCNNPPSIPNVWRYILAILPIVLNGYIFAVLSSANDALVPLTLKQFGNSTEIALSQFGIFEAFVMPIMFFPSVILQNLSVILVPEIARAKSSGNISAVRRLTAKVFRNGLSWAILVACILGTHGREIGALVCGDSLVGNTLMILCPVIPFIYLEIVLEGILKGLGKQNFCTLNSLAEYILRISAVLICIPIMGFGGIIVSYFVSNIACNISRIHAVLKATELEFSFTEMILIPLFSAGVGWQFGKLAAGIIHTGGILETAVYVFTASGIFLVTEWVLRKLSVPASPKTVCGKL